MPHRRRRQTPSRQNSHNPPRFPHRRAAEHVRARNAHVRSVRLLNGHARTQHQRGTTRRHRRTVVAAPRGHLASLERRPRRQVTRLPPDWRQLPPRHCLRRPDRRRAGDHIAESPAAETPGQAARGQALRHPCCRRGLTRRRQGHFIILMPAEATRAMAVPERLLTTVPAA